MKASKAIENVTKVKCQRDTSVSSVKKSSNERTQEEESLNGVMAFCGLQLKF